MKNSELYFGNTVLNSHKKDVSFETVDLKDDIYFKIENYDEMNPFFMTIVSAEDFWLFVSSTGGLTAGRKSPEHALFPYYTDDKIHDSYETTGSHTSMIVTCEEKRFIWEPFAIHNSDVYKITRNLYKNTLGNRIMCEEINHDLNISYRYTWKTSDRYGIVKEAELINLSENKLSAKVLDGIRNILPYGVNQLLQTTKSTLVDGYKRNELIEQSGLGLFTLSSIISDKAEPSESLKSTTVWTKGLDNPIFLLSEQQVKSFNSDQSIYTEDDIKGRRGAFYVSSTVSLKAQESTQWVIVSEINQSAVRIESLIQELEDEKVILSNLNLDISKGDEKLKKLVFEADGLQLTGHTNVAYRHFSNTLFNIMRGGIYADGYNVNLEDLKQFINTWNKDIYQKHLGYLDSLGDVIHYRNLLENISGQKDVDLERLVYEYLPLTYSRRHGDPSRPWYKFNIELTKGNGEKNLNFEGNWRDIFQNWEALSLSYPMYVEGIISKFVNASTADGYNPYRITKEGIDWELLDPEDPWSNIGYWGDHQIIYLLKLMELSKKYNSEKLAELLRKETFVYANVPYRIKNFDYLIKDPRNTILFDDACEELVEKRVNKIGSDGKLLFVGDKPYYVNLMEKLLVMVLSKLSNYIPEGGIWLNTQRPEWNDANNALVGNGVSMVTLYYMHRCIGFLAEMVDDINEDIMVSSEVHTMFENIFEVLNENSKYLDESVIDKNETLKMDDQVRLDIVTELGRIGETYRQVIYSNGFSGDKKSISTKSLGVFLEVTNAHLKDTIKKNKREDGLYNAYNLVKFTDNSCSISYLYEMLEGQVAVLSSKALNTSETLEVLKSLRESQIYREDQNSYMLYPNRELARFLEKNIVSKEKIESSTVLKAELEKGYTRFIEQDVNGNYHFNGQFRNSEEVVEAILKTKSYEYDDVIVVGEIFSDLFNHHAFTGRSGTFYKYEGLGCIYWHMVSKLILATQESYESVDQKNAASDDLNALSDYFHELKAGIGVEKSPINYGAFPTDAYSHTPGFAGVQQPGMTGQVKEDFISRFAELGVNVKGGELRFEPQLLSISEFLEGKTIWSLPTMDLELDKQQLAFTVCTVPVVYALNNNQSITVCYKNGDRYTFENTSKLTKEISQSVFDREGKIEKIIVNVDKYCLRHD